MAWLLDTNLLSEAWRQAPDRKVLSWLDQHVAASYVSTISLGEIWKGLQLLPVARRKRFELQMSELEQDYADRFLSADSTVMKRWGEYVAAQSKLGRTLDTIDSLIAATALTHDLTLATRNTTDFPGVRTVNPWGK